MPELIGYLLIGYLLDTVNITYYYRASINPPAALDGRYSYHPNFTGKDTEAQEVNSLAQNHMRRFVDSFGFY